MYSGWTVYVDTEEFGRVYFLYEVAEEILTLFINSTILQVWIVN